MLLFIHLFIQAAADFYIIRSSRIEESVFNYFYILILTPAEVLLGICLEIRTELILNLLTHSYT